MIQPGEIDRVFVELNTRLVKFKRAFMQETVRRVEQRTPVRTGALKAGWLGALTQTGFTVSNVREYADYVENGTPHQRPQKMLATTILEKDQIAEVAKREAGL